jgi:hypothetical protein
MLKICFKCKQAKDETEFYDHPKNGKSAWCTYCVIKYKKDNREKLLKYYKEYHKKNKDRRNKEKREHYRKNKERIKNRVKKYREKIKEEKNKI